MRKNDLMKDNKYESARRALIPELLKETVNGTEILFTKMIKYLCNFQ